MNKQQAIQAIKQGKKVRPINHLSGGYIFSYDGIMASMVTDSGKTITNIQPIDDFINSHKEGTYKIVDAFSMDTNDISLILSLANKTS